MANDLYNYDDDIYGIDPLGEIEDDELLLTQEIDDAIMEHLNELDTEN